jgi:hypothetical protein
MLPVTPPAPANLNYEALEQIPGTDGFINARNFPAYMQALYKFVIGGVAIAGLLMLVIGGFFYMTAAGNNSQLTKAKSIITDALIGIIVALFAWLLLFTINPDLVSIDLSRLGYLTTDPKHNPLASGSDTSNAQRGPAGSAPVTGNCGGMDVRGIKATQCGDASPELVTFLECMHEILPDAAITSISDDNAVGNLSACQGDNHKPYDRQNRTGCAHMRNSCHYGGRAQNSQSYAVDLTYRTNITPEQYIEACQSCNGIYCHQEPYHFHADIKPCQQPYSGN